MVLLLSTNMKFRCRHLELIIRTSQLFMIALNIYRRRGEDGKDMYQYYTMNAISQVGLSRFTGGYVQTNALENADMILVRSADMHGVTLPPSVIAVARAGAGVNNIPTEDYAAQGVVVFNTPGANANGVKEMVFAGMLLAARDVVDGINWVKKQKGDPEVAKKTEKEKKRFAGSELSGKKLGVIGLGAIGVLVANAAVHLGMDVYGYDPYISVEAAWNLSRNIKHISDVSQIYSECDYITIHVPLLPDTRNMIGRDAISLMKPSAVILNFSRDLLVDEEAVLEALDEGRVHRYVCDFPDPLTTGHEKVILSPHLGASTSESEDNCAKMAVRELMDYVRNGNITNSVNYPACSLGELRSAVRIAICHRNVPKMISHFTNILADNNIAHMNNSSRGDYAYTLLDLDTVPGAEALRALEKVDDVLRVRVIDPNGMM